MNEPFAGRRLCIATMHGKERVIGPHLEGALGVRCELPPRGFDSDRFGTFSGEVPRTGTALDTARAKAIAAMDAAGVDLAVASEGSFGPHPEVGLVAVGAELVLLVDRRHDLEIAGEHVTVETNHARRRCHSLAEVTSFGERVGFPTHSLVLTLGDPPQRVWRGLHTATALADAVTQVVTESRHRELPWYAASDMRADQNPTRMRAIERAAESLAQRATTRCPACGMPGFGVVEVVRGLPCADCGMPTPRPRALVEGCASCGEHRTRPRHDGVVLASPGECSGCNP